MKMTYTDLLGEYNELFDNQPEEVRELIGFQIASYKQKMPVLLFVYMEFA